MTYNYKCNKCKELSEVDISFADITGIQGKINQEKMNERIYYRKCNSMAGIKRELCGGDLQIVINAVDFSFKDKGQYERARKMAEDFNHFDK